ncbi:MULTISPECIES: DUF3221 domain-containing protein [Pontibacillus]|uniref:DUF3221 domain-containing protein n=1 Tax=Pontibacillus chungwhensis TaxID=265426 RepID=A0ABY8V6K6_9BACI|nr:MULTISPECIES: DUF3221 domain-containing protein [Pontibacillus]MCD5322197.1 YobA family protein [Pontibacillus sp. HN14]WIF99491.1 DUF3221 domain-containing protein [Pontibacillus chungwhensis]
MRKGLFLMCCLLLMSLLIAGCHSSDDSVNQDMEKPSSAWYVMDKNDSKILVVKSNPKDVNNNGGYDAIWGSGDIEGVSIGDRVDIKVEGSVMESYPPQGKFGEVEILSEEKPEGATLSKSEALRKALSNMEHRLKMVEAIDFIEEKDMWSVKLQDGDEVLEVSVDDE